MELRAEDVQLLSDSDAVAAFFGRLGYDTNPRTVQTPGNLGITSENTLRRIRKIELIADNEGLLQVYLFQLPSVTVADARALATAFRNRVGNFLLVLTADFERIDFVLLEKYLPADQDRSIAQPQVKVRPRTLSLERRKPERLQLRVLGRFTWTEADAFAQYEKLLAAYGLAYWSEEYFNNRALFSDYFLKERLTDPEEFPEWKEDPKPAYTRLRQIYQTAAPNLAGAGKAPLLTDLVQPTFTELGFDLERGGKGERPEEPDYRLYARNHETGDAPLAVCLAYPWHRFLDGKDERRDADTPEHNPGQRVVSLLETGEAPWIILTNGRLWRLYSQSAPSRASNFYEVDLGDALGQTAPFAGEPADAFRYFWLLFRRQSFETGTAREAPAPSLLDRLFHGSREFAARLGENLKERVFEQIFQVLADGFITDIRRREGKDADLPQERLDEIFQGVLTLLYRLLFLLYAEARDLLPVRETREYFDASLTKLKNEIELAAGPIRDDEGRKLHDHYRTSSTALYDRLTRLFAVIDRGGADLNVPRYNGGLFLSKVSDDDGSPEAAAARFLNKNKVPDPFLAHALDLLSRDEDPKQHKLVPIDFKSLGVRQLGSIYEGLLEFKLRIASEKKAIVKEKARDVYVPFQDLSERERERVENQKRIVKRGELYLENDKGERKATGSYYTPDHIVSYIVEHAVGPVVKEKFEAMRLRLREAEQWHRQAVRNAKAKSEDPNKYESGPAVETKWYTLVNDLFDLKILDPAMGSGHFLVETVDYITDKMLAFLNSFPWNPVTAHLDLVRQTILDEMDAQQISIDQRRLTDVNLLKRHVLKRCIYGVDLNPMAVELAKVSLWLHCFTLGAPLSFLDHHMRCGNSLVGVSVAEVQDQLRQGTLFGSAFTGLMLATDLMRHVGELSDVTSAQVNESRVEYRTASEALAPFKKVLDLYTGEWFRDEPIKKPRAKSAEVDTPVVAFLKGRDADSFIQAKTRSALEKAFAAMSPGDRLMAKTALSAAKSRRFFHWELEFPEVFYGPRSGTERTIERLDCAGFDAVIGNPPYVRQAVLKEYKSYFSHSFEPVHDASNDLYVYFFCREIELLRPGGFIGLIVANKWLRVGYGKKLRSYLVHQARPVSLVDFGHSPIFPDADTFPCVPTLQKRLKPLPPSAPPPENESVQACVFPRDEYLAGTSLPFYLSSKAHEVPLRFLRDTGWSLESPSIQSLLEKLVSSGQSLKQIGIVPHWGTVTGLNDAFYIDGSQRDKLVQEDRRSGEIIVPLLRGRDIERWRALEPKTHMIVARRGINIDEYPAIKRHLATFRDRLQPKARTGSGKNSSIGRASGEYAWYELQASPSDEFIRATQAPKIVYQEIQFHSRFALDDSGAYINNKVFMLPTNDLAILAILNSSLMWWVLTRVLPHMKDEALTPSAFLMENLRLCLPTGDLREMIERDVKELCGVADNRHELEDASLTRMRKFAGAIDRTALLWLRLSDSNIERMMQRMGAPPMSSRAKSELTEFRRNTAEGLTRLLTQQLQVEEHLRSLIEDAYELTPEERSLLRVTAPIRDPVDALRKTLTGIPDTAEQASDDSGVMI